MFVFAEKIMFVSLNCVIRLCLCKYCFVLCCLVVVFNRYCRNTNDI